MKRNMVLLLVLILLSLIGTLFVYKDLPQEIPLHWNIKGEVDRTGPKIMIWLVAMMPLFVVFLMWLTPKIDPRKDNYRKFEGSYVMIRTGIALVMLCLYWIIILATLGVVKDINAWIQIAMAILFIFLGNFMPKVRHNYFLGIKTPWTLANESVWKKTHRLGGYLFAMSGLVTLISMPFGSQISMFVLLVAVLLTTLVTVVYSFLAYRRL